ncbi:MAG TPA: 30S ribosomal protein S4 [Candidatus Pacearchaeota archaeon]|nr:30S ribosomal protein S4 [Candidatus Parcubacteria bacterium]HNP79374.1 30S ribosomal protein S4 [Candidatus Pacearchaeota archaeon]HOC53820.1 30S ribosomal protein S4 [Candidatus Pacearchaeota archaeon]HQM24562.1 30S ribosomal protein S4 [Candidatus Pacearchaeota archaeon]
METKNCKICRRLGEKLFLKGERCMSAKCAMIKRAYPPGQKAKKRRGALSEYGKELREKQKMKKWYNLSESQMKKYVNDVAEKRSKIDNVADALVGRIESRLDNIVFRLGFAKSRAQASKLVSHGHFMVNGRKVDIPSYEIKIGDVISIRPGSKKKEPLKDLETLTKNYKLPKWLDFNKELGEGKFVKKPIAEDVQLPVEIATLFEHYSR